MIPADAVINRLLASPTVTDITRVMWAGGTAEAEQMPALTVQVAERPAYSTIQSAIIDTLADITVVALATTYHAAYELAEVIRAALHGFVLAEQGISMGPITWDRLDAALVANVSQTTVYQVPQVFTCTIRRQ